MRKNVGPGVISHGINNVFDALGIFAKGPGGKDFKKCKRKRKCGRFNKEKSEEKLKQKLQRLKNKKEVIKKKLAEKQIKREEKEQKKSGFKYDPFQEKVELLEFMVGETKDEQILSNRKEFLNNHKDLDLEDFQIKIVKNREKLQGSKIDN